MQDNGNHGKRAPRQEWKPNFLVRILYRLWKLLFGAVKVALGALVTVLLICIVCGFVFINILGGYLEDEVMSIAAVNLEDLELDKTSFIYYVDSEGQIQILQQIYSTTNRQWIYYEDIPEELINACVAIEDKRFFQHQGVDWITTVKACVSMFFNGSEFGGSTITQQFIKNYYGDDDVTVQRKVMEIFRAIAMEKTYDKEVIIEWYMNTVYFGEGCYGVKSAAANYFGKEVQDMNAAELASLIGITNNPSLYRPYRTTLDKGGMTGAERNRVRQLTILEEMHIQGWLSDEEYKEAVNYPMVFKQGIASEDRWAKCENEDCGYQGAVRTLVSMESQVGNTVYYCPECKHQIVITTDASQSVYSWYVDEVIDQVAQEMARAEGIEESRIAAWNTDAEAQLREMYRSKLGRGGYHIYTPFDADVQQAVDKIYTNLEEIPKVKSEQQLQSGIVVINNATGDIAAMAGGVGEKKDFDAFNRATDATLQTGSSLKPLTVYAPAFELGLITPASVIDDLPMTYNNGVPFPRNANRVYRNSRTVWRGIVSSVNTTSVNILEMIGTRNSYEFAKYQFGLSTLTDHHVTASGTILTDVGYSALGMGGLTHGATVRDMACAYATFANDGVYREGRVWTKVYDSYGNLVLENTQDSRKLLGEKALTYINYCLDGVISSGTGLGADMYLELGMDVAGKTGSTDDNKDRYFVGYTGYYTAAVWCGFDIPEEVILTESAISPADTLWKKVMLQIHQNLETIPLFDSTDLVRVTVCLDSGKLATDACGCDIRGVTRTETLRVHKDDVPKEFCDKHTMVAYCGVGGCAANEWCHKFANVGAIQLDEKALVKITPSRLKELDAARVGNLEDTYLRDDYVYLVNPDGTDAEFHGFKEDVNEDVIAPYLVCTEHTQEAWEQFLSENPGIEDEKDPEGGSEENPDEGTDENPEDGTEENPDEGTGENPEDGTEEDNNNWWDELLDWLPNG